MSCAEDLDSASQSSPPKSDFSLAKEEMYREWNVQREINRKNRRRVDAHSDSKSNTHVTLEDSNFIETMGDACMETYSPRVPAG